MFKRRDHSCFQKCLFFHHHGFRDTCYVGHFSLCCACKPILPVTDVAATAALSGWNPFSVSWILKISQKNQRPAGKMLTLSIFYKRKSYSVSLHQHSAHYEYMTTFIFIKVFVTLFLVHPIHPSSSCTWLQGAGSHPSHLWPKVEFLLMSSFFNETLKSLSI